MGQDQGRLSADLLLVKRKVPQDPFPTYPGMVRVPREPDVEMAKDGDEGYVWPSLTYIDRESGRFPEGTTTRA